MRRILVVSIVTVPLASAAFGGGSFEIVQPPLPGAAIASQDFPNLPDYSCACLDDFTITEPVTLASLRIFGLDQAIDGASLNLDVRAWILTGPDLGATPVAALHGAQVEQDLVFNLEDLVLGAGTYWIAAQVVRPFVSGQQWMWVLSSTTNGAEAMFHNPDGGFGYGTSPVPVSGIESGLHDMAFSLQGVPSPAGVAAFLAAGFLPRRRRA